ncbi:MAG: hypothetical protein BWY57_02132 [Betaproteobacteria bacterium ADurb.Bin341]|nr:MAG: hypothetical protein BWY57_02132 [Betaproteobacteria bacterium ADurb.Bin341]
MCCFAFSTKAATLSGAAVRRSGSRTSMVPYWISQHFSPSSVSRQIVSAWRIRHFATSFPAIKGLFRQISV